MGEITRVTTQYGVVDDPLEREGEIRRRLRDLEADPGSTEENSGAERDRLIGEYTEIRRAVRSAAISRGMAAMANPANLEAGADPVAMGGKVDGAPALVRNPGTRIESPQETLQRMHSDPWRGPDGDPLAGHTSYGRPGETAAGFVSRANACLEGLEERLTHDGAELLSTLLSERRDTPRVSVRRSADEVRQAAEMIVALSSPYYESAMRSVFRNPDLFRTGIGTMVWSDDEREAVHQVVNNELVRAAFAESSGATGAFALPLQLDGTILFTNAGIASPHRNLARHELMTSNTWNGDHLGRGHRELCG
jgi:hypothetical protein